MIFDFFFLGGQFRPLIAFFCCHNVFGKAWYVFEFTHLFEAQLNEKYLCFRSYVIVNPLCVYKGLCTYGQGHVVACMSEIKSIRSMCVFLQVVSSAVNPMILRCFASLGLVN